GQDGAPARRQRGQQRRRRLAEGDHDRAVVGGGDAGDGLELGGLRRAGLGGADAVEGGHHVGGVERRAVVEGGLDELEGVGEAVVGDGVGGGKRRHDLAGLVHLHQRVVDRLADLEGRGGGGDLRVEGVGLGAHGQGEGLGQGGAAEGREARRQGERSEVPVEANGEHATYLLWVTSPWGRGPGLGPAPRGPRT